MRGKTYTTIYSSSIIIGKIVFRATCKFYKVKIYIIYILLYHALSSTQAFTAFLVSVRLK